MLASLRAKACQPLYPRASPQTFLSSFWIQKYRISTVSQARYDPTIHNFTSELSKRQPSFSVPANGISVLSHPDDFYTLLLDMIKNAENRIFLSSLYIGSNESELVSTLKNALERKPSLQLHLQLDLNRSTRPGASSTAKILLPLLHSFPERVHVSFFRSPSLRGVMAKLVPPRFNEGWGTWHAKIYGVDDDVIISGANLNEAYFTNRQDRYIHFKKQGSLANYCFDFLQATSLVSYRLLPADSPNIVSIPRSSYSYTQENYSLLWPDQDTHPHRFNDKFRQALVDLQSKAKTINASSGSTSQNPHNVVLFPVIQAGQFNIREEQDMFELLFRNLKQNGSLGSESANGARPLLDLTSGYFGLSEKYQDLVLGCPEVDVRIVAASPKANGFFGSKGISGRIPEGYTYLEQRFMKAVRAAGREWSASGSEGGIQLSEWEKQGWTYHAKGLWLSPTPTSSPVLTLFGSTNLNSRSAELDTELSFVMVLPSQENASVSQDSPIDTLRSQLAQEVQQIRKDATGWKGGEREVRLGTKMLVKIVGGML
ncbi:hypothetical protein K435DRAFT_776198 [Dendrothele bispora CBS 962.96]|uniref:CDP-diacylglycerol--glycerol-3-phosphate 3-phosphatidyltransferase n=1 Tax=Dendrothele bispora (strain CBS 962.96) TaxID=1314807 RepID=A0A4S8MEJ7_DENBC|nr:hypothetical protein K435DRAFT_776198 [Dendrothele bispora CBS 962.96]